MKTLDDLLVLGDPKLYETSLPVLESELPLVKNWVSELHHVMQVIRKKYGFGRGIAAAQLGIMKQLFYINIDKPLVVINPELKNLSEETFELWDDCMSFPNLLVKVRRHRSLTLTYLDENWHQQTLHAKDDLSELIQHEYDHLHGVLCTMRAINDQSFKWKK